MAYRYPLELTDALRVIEDFEDVRLRRMMTGREVQPGRCVYFLQARPMSLIKIGSSSDPIKRVRDLRRTSPEPLNVIRIIWGDYTSERILHGKFDEERQHGEWFSPSFRLTSFIHSIHWADVRDELLEDARSFEDALA